MELIRHWIDNEAYAGAPERRSPVYNPATGLVRAEVALATVTEVDAAIARYDIDPEAVDPSIA